MLVRIIIVDTRRRAGDYNCGRPTGRRLPTPGALLGVAAKRVRESFVIKIMATIAIALVSPFAAMADFDFNSNHEISTTDCHGQNANVNGNQNVLTLKNCGTISVQGNQNAVIAISVKKVDVLGNQNRVNYVRAKGVS